MLVDPIITNKGLALLAKITTNTLTISNMGIGDGEKTISESVDSLANEILKNQVEYVQMEGNVIDIRTTFTNENLETGFYIKEVGIYAIDPDEGEILYAYTCVNGTNADYFSPGSGNVLLREIIQLLVGFGNASGITLTIEPTSVYMTVDDYEKISLPTFEDYETNTELPTPATALSAIKSKGKLQTILSNIKAFLKQAVTWDKVAYNYTTNVKGYAADARCAKELKAQLDLLNNNLPYSFTVSIDNSIVDDAGYKIYDIEVGLDIVANYRPIISLNWVSTTWDFTISSLFITVASDSNGTYIRIGFKADVVQTYEFNVALVKNKNLPT